LFAQGDAFLSSIVFAEFVAVEGEIQPGQQGVAVNGTWNKKRAAGERLYAAKAVAAAPGGLVFRPCDRTHEPMMEPRCKATTLTRAQRTNAAA
jgi:hypothetical protein